MDFIYVTYTPQYAGAHWVCYKQTSPTLDSSYCCILDATPSTVGVPKTITIQVAVSTCTLGGPVSPVGTDPGTYTYNGYVQAACSSEGVDQIAWTAPVDFVVAAP